MLPSPPIRTEFPTGICALTYDLLDISSIVTEVESSSAGAMAIFIGTTRDNFQGKIVTQLEYQAYSKLAIRTLQDILLERTGAIIRSVVYHRLGIVPVGEASIVIAVSSPHRKEAFLECERILEEVKKKAQIWKREFYAGEDEETAQWKANQ